MKKSILCILVVIIIIIVVITIKISSNNKQSNDVSSYNSAFEQYKEKTLYGADVLSIINKAIDNNTINNIEKDEDGYYIANDTNSINVEITLLSTDEKGEIHELKYPMEILEKSGLNTFIASFSLTKFECTAIQYNSLGKVSKIMLKQLEV